MKNTGHGHVRPRPDGVKARCGGPRVCAVCAKEADQDREEIDWHGECEKLRQERDEAKAAIKEIKLETLAAVSVYLPTPVEGYAFLWMLISDIHRLGKERDALKAKLAHFEGKTFD